MMIVLNNIVLKCQIQMNQYYKNEAFFKKKQKESL